MSVDSTSVVARLCTASAAGACIAAALLAGCGQKGPLFLPKTGSQVTPAASAPPSTPPTAIK